VIAISDKKILDIFNTKHINVTIEPFTSDWRSTYSTISTESIDVARQYVDRGFEHARDLIPEDSNVAFEAESDIVYLTDVRKEDGGLNRVVRVDTKNMTFQAITLKGSNPHSIDRAGSSDKFYIRTQNSTSISVVNFKENSEKSIDLGKYRPKTSGATNLKYNLQLIAMQNAPVISIIDTKTDTVLETVGDKNATAKKSATGHAMWLDVDHFCLTDRVNKRVLTFKVNQSGNKLSFTQTDTMLFQTPVHILHKVETVYSEEDLTTFYAMVEGSVNKNIAPSVAKIHFDATRGTITVLKETPLPQSDKAIDGINPSAHHGGTSPDGKYFFATTLDGKTYVLETTTMQIVKVLPTGLGAGHVNFSKEENVAVVTNHFSSNVTIIDLATLEIKAQIIISNTKFDPENKKLLQMHTPLISQNGRYFFTGACHDGDFVKIDLRDLKIDSKLHIGGALEQTSS